MPPRHDSVAPFTAHELDQPLAADFSTSIARGTAQLRLEVRNEFDEQEVSVDHLTAWVGITVPNKPSFSLYRICNQNVPMTSARLADLVALADQVEVAPCLCCGVATIHSVPGTPDIEPTCDQCYMTVAIAEIEEALTLELAAVREELDDMQKERAEGVSTHVLVIVAEHDRGEQRDWYGAQAHAWLAPSIRFELHLGAIGEPTTESISMAKKLARMGEGAQHWLITIDESMAINQSRLQKLERLVAQHGGSIRAAAQARFPQETQGMSDAMIIAAGALSMARDDSRSPPAED